MSDDRYIAGTVVKSDQTYRLESKPFANHYQTKFSDERKLIGFSGSRVKGVVNWVMGGKPKEAGICYL